MCLVAFLGIPALPVQADVASAEDVAWRMAIKYKDRGFNLHDVARYGTLSLPTQNYRKFKLRIVKGLDYVFLAALDAADKLGRPKDVKELVQSWDDLDIYVYSDVGQRIVDDTRDLKASMAGVQFRAEYNGEVDVYLHLYQDKDHPAIPRPIGWYVLVGNRGTAFNPDIPSPSAPEPDLGSDDLDDESEPIPAAPRPAGS